MKRVENLQFVIDNFINWKKQGLSIGEISQKTGISKSTIYRHLDVIAESNNCTRDELLSISETKNDVQNDQNSISEKWDNIISELDKLISEISKEEDRND